MSEIICKAIKEKKVISFSYKGDKRIVEPHLVGEKTTGNIVLSAYQTGGHSDSGKIPAWKNYILDEISNVIITDVTFSSRPGYNPNDSTMLRIICRI